MVTLCRKDCLVLTSAPSCTALRHSILALRSVALHPDTISRVPYHYCLVQLLEGYALSLAHNSAKKTDQCNIPTAFYRNLGSGLIVVSEMKCLWHSPLSLRILAFSYTLTDVQTHAKNLCSSAWS